MTKRLSSKYSVCKKLKSRYKNLWGGSGKDSCRSVLSIRKKRQMSHFSKLLNIKQSYKLFYSNLSEKSFKRLTLYSVKSRSKTMDKLTSLLESRIDSSLFRSCFVQSFHQARQLVNHKCIFVNHLCVKNPSKKLFSGDVVSIKKFVSSQHIFHKVVSSRSIPSHLEVNISSFSFVFLWDPNLKGSYFPVERDFPRIARFYR